MASQWALDQRKIQPRQGQPRSVPDPNFPRRTIKKAAKELGMTPKRVAKMIKRGKLNVEYEYQDKVIELGKNK